MIVNRRMAVLALALALAAPAFAKEEKLEWKSGEEKAMGFLVTPEGKGPFPAVIVIQEWWGLNDWVKDQARALAKEGYVALAVDLYRGKVTANPDEAHQYMSGLSQDQAVRDLKSAFATLAARSNVKPNKIVSGGRCRGGRYPHDPPTAEPAPFPRPNPRGRPPPRTRPRPSRSSGGGRRPGRGRGGRPSGAWRAGRPARRRSARSRRACRGRPPGPPPPP